MHVSKKGRGSKSRKMHVALAEDMAYMQSYSISNPTAQIFVTGPKSNKETLTHEEKTQLATYTRRHNTKLVIHGAYIDRPWGGVAYAVQNVLKELRIASEIGATGVILHLSAGCGDDIQLSSALKSISGVYAELTAINPAAHIPILWLEIHAAKPSAFTYETPEKLIRLFERIHGYGHNNGPNELKFGLCIDTAHLFSCGTNLDTYENAERWIRNTTEGISKIMTVPIMMHLNDSASKLGSGVDRHEILCGGMIWSAYHPVTGHLPFERSGLNYILEWVEKNHIHTILERDDADLVHDITLIQKLGYFSG